MIKITALIFCGLFFFVGGYFLMNLFMNGGNIPIPFSSNTKPAGLKVNTQLASYGSRKLISASGGEIAFKDGQEKEVILQFPKNSVLGSSDIEVHQIEYMDNLPDGLNFISGVNIKSDEDFLGDSAILTLQIPDSAKKKKIIGFAFDNAGENFHLYPVTFKDNTASFNLNHFSGYGLLTISDTYKSPPDPLTIRQQAEQNIAKILIEAQKDQLKGATDLTDNQKNRIRNLLKVWFKTFVKIQLESAKNKDDLVIDSAKEFLIWLKSVQLLGQEKELNSEITEAKSLLAIAIKNAYESDYKKCTNEKDPTQAGKLVKLYVLAELLGFNGLNGLDVNQIKDKALKCANFKLRVSSVFTVNGPESCGADKEDYSGEIPLEIDKNFTLSGNGQIKSNEISVCDTVCRGTPLITQVEVPMTKLITNSNKTDISLIIKTNDENNDTYDCSYLIKGTETTFGYHSNLYGWYATFYNAHENEEIGQDEVKISDWQIIGKDGVYARKEYNITHNKDSDYPEQEKSVFELIHTPK